MEECTSDAPERGAAGARREVAGAGAGAASAPARSATLTLHAGETVVALPLEEGNARTLGAAFREVLAAFSDKAKGGDALARYENMDWSATGSDGTHLEIFCNPNMAADAFSANALVTVQSAAVRVVVEVRLSDLKSDLEAYAQVLKQQ
eukprot:PRCOL_00003959-RA